MIVVVFPCFHWVFGWKNTVSWSCRSIYIISLQKPQRLPIYFWNRNFGKYLRSWILPSYPVGSPKSTYAFSSPSSCRMRYTGTFRFASPYLSPSENLRRSSSGGQELVFKPHLQEGSDQRCRTESKAAGALRELADSFPETQPSNICSWNAAGDPPGRHGWHSLPSTRKRVT